MFSLIITIIAIALVAVLGLSTLYFGGTAFNQSSTRAEAAKVVNQGQQLIGAADLYYADHGFWPASLDELESENYLQAVPVAELGAVAPAFAGTTRWVMVAPSHPVFSVPSSSTDACRTVNLLTSGVDGIPAHAITSWTTQCYGTSTSNLQMLTAKNAVELNLAIPETIDAPANCTSADWLVAPQSCGAAPLGLAVGTLTGDMAFGDQTMGTTSATRYATLTNTGDAILDITDLSISGPFSFLHDCGTTLGIGRYCTASVNFSPVAEGDATGQLLIINSGGISIAPLSGFGTFASDSLVPHTLAFAATALGAASAAQDVTLSNTGNIPLGLSPVTFNAPFSAATTCTTSLAVGASCTYSVTFSPTVMGEALDSVTVTTAAGIENLSLSGVGTQRSASAAPGTLTFAATAVGQTSAVQTVTLTNTGNLSVNIASDTALVPFAASTTCGTTLAAGANCTYSVTFSPSVMGAATGSLSIVTDAGTKTISLSALGTQVSATATPGSLTLATTNVGSTSAAQTVTLTNTGNLPFNVTSGSTAAPFAVSTTCGATLAASAACNYSVTFVPTVMGDANGTLTILTAAGTKTIALGAHASQSVATLAPGSLTFASTSLGSSTAAQSVTLANTGNTPLTVSPATFVAPYAGTTTCTASLAVGASCTYSVTFTPSAMGAATANVSIVTSEATHTLSLSGFGTQLSGTILPSTLTFAATAVGGVSAAQSVVLTNTGNLPLTVTAAATTGTFSQSGNCPGSLAAGEHCSYQVAFNPTAMGTATGSLSILTDAQEFIVALNGWGDQLSGSLAPTSVTFSATAIGSSATAQVVTVTNTGNTPLGMSAVTFAAPFLATTTCTTSLAASATCTYSVGFTPNAMGNAAASVSIVTSAATYTLELSGYGTQLSGTLTPSTLAFASTNLGASAAAQTATLTNTGNLPLAITSGNAAAPFSATTTCGATLDAGNSCTYSVGFNPTVMGSASNNFSVVTSAGTKTVGLSGFGEQTSSSVSTGALSFASTQVGATSATQTVTLNNTGNTSLTIAAPSISGPFAISSTTCTGTLAASASCNYVLSFSPIVVGAATGSLFLEPSSGEQPVSLSGTGLQGNASLSPTSLTFGTTTVGQSAATQTVTLTNNGTYALTVSSVTVSTGAADYSRATTCGVVAINGTCTVTVTFTPSASGPLPGAVTLAHNGTGSTSFALSGTGSGPASVLTSAFSLTTVPAGTPSTFTWTTSGAASATVACTGKATGSGSGTSGSISVTTLTGTGTGTCTVTALNAAGTAYTGSADVTVIPATYTLGVTGGSFANTNLNTTSAGVVFTTTNNGNTSVTLSTTPTASGVFSVSANTCTASKVLALGATCTTTVTGMPTAMGVNSGTLSVNAATGNGTAALSITGLQSSSSISTALLTLASTNVGSTSAAQTVTLTNTGNTTLTISTPSVTAPFAVSATTCGATLAAGTNCTYSATFTPTSVGDSYGTLFLEPNSGEQVVSLFGTGLQGNVSLSPSSLTFGATTVGATSATQTVTLTNNGTAALTVSSVTVSSGATDFGKSTTCATIAVNGTCTVSVSFTPTVSGARSGTITLADNGTGSTSFALSGTGAGAPTVTSAFFSQATVPAGATDTFNWTTGGGATSATVACTGKATGSGSGLSGNFAATTLTGTGAGTCTVTATNAAGTTATGAATMTVIPATFMLGVTGSSFASTNVGSTSAGVTFTTTNNGNTSVTLSTTPTASGVFSVSANTCTAALVLIPTATCTTTVTGTPTVVGANAGTFTVYSVTGNGTAALSINGITPHLDYQNGGGTTITALSFPNTAVGSNSGALVATLKNTGTANLVFGSPGVTVPAPFSLSANTCDGATVAPGASCTVSVVFSPTGAQAYGGGLSVSTNDAAAGALALTGTGTMSAVVQIVAGNSHTVVLRVDGTVWATGNNAYGQLGDGTTTERHTFVQAQGIVGTPTAIAVGAYHTVVIAGGTVQSVGRNYAGQLADNTTTERHTFVQAQGIVGTPTAIAVGAGYTVVIAGSTVQSVGSNYYGQLGDGTTTNHSTFVQAQGIVGTPTAIAVGDANTAVIAGGTVWTVGHNNFGQLGVGTYNVDHSTFVQAQGIVGTPTAISAGMYHTVVIAGGTVQSVGYNSKGQLGTNNTTTSSTFVRAQGIVGTPTAIAAGGYHTVVMAGGTVQVVGLNAYGQLSDGTATERHTFVQAQGIAGTPTAIAAGTSYTAVIAGGAVQSVGQNSNGQLGTNNTANRSTFGGVTPF